MTERNFICIWSSHSFYLIQWIKSPNWLICPVSDLSMLELNGCSFVRSSTSAGVILYSVSRSKVRHQGQSFGRPKYWSKSQLRDVANEPFVLWTVSTTSTFLSQKPLAEISGTKPGHFLTPQRCFRIAWTGNSTTHRSQAEILQVGQIVKNQEKFYGP